MILIIDDDFSVTASLALLLKQAGLAAQSAASPQEALQKLTHEKFDLILQDMNFSRRTSGEEGIALLKEIKQRQPHAPIILITAWGSIELAVKGMQAGASDFITKPWSNEQLLQAVKTALKLSAVSAEPAQTAITREALEAQHDFSNLVGRAPNFLRVLDLAGRVSATEASVLITGESGTGKELIAEAIHRNSERKDGPFIKVNLGGISATLFESEMFGHVKGAFTGAIASRPGKFQQADGGTLFLDEVGELTPQLQVKLLRAIQERVVYRVGDSRPEKCDIRIIAATNRNLEEMIKTGEFREDLYYRLNVVNIWLPPLRERADDIFIIAKALLSKYADELGSQVRGYSPQALAAIKRYTWPGNIRQLENRIKKALVLCDKSLLGPEDMDLGPEAMEPIVPLEKAKEDFQRRYVLEVLERNNGNRTQTARDLGVDPRTIFRYLEKEQNPMPSGAGGTAVEKE